MATPDHFDVAVIGAGVIGLAVARVLAAAPFMANRSLVLLDQEEGFGKHTSSRSSEVIHAGIYYPTGSLKADLCVRGRHLLYEHCRRFKVPCRCTGKLIVASAGESTRLEALHKQGAANGVTGLALLDAGTLSSLEECVRADLALISPSSGIIDSHSYMLSLLHLAQMHGAIFAPNTRVEAISQHGDGLRVDTRVKSSVSDVDSSYQFAAGAVVCCAGLQSEALARRFEGLEKLAIPRQYFCKGDYFSYAGQNPFNHLVYPIPETNTTGLGIHATPDMAGCLRFGPDVSFVDTEIYTVDPQKRDRFAEAIRKYFPGIEAQHLNPDYAGIRPRLSGPGEPAADFVIQDGTPWGVPNLTLLFGIESPGLTASLAIAEKVAGMVNQSF